MMVNGPLEIYSTVIGIKTFDSLFNVLASMGIIFLPLLVMFFQNITTPYESEIENGASTSLRMVTIQFFLWVISVMLFIAPTWKLNVTAISYKPACAGKHFVKPSVFGDTGTTYDDAFSNLVYKDLKLPIMMAFTLSGMSGFTNAAITSLPCKTDVQAIKSTINTTRLTPEVAQQVERFQNECFAPARTKFDSQHPKVSTYQDTMKKYGGQTDLSWIGSHVFQSLYYNHLYPATPVPGFPYSEYRFQYHEYNKTHGGKGVAEPEWGYPSCKEWWANKQHGLQQQMVELVDAHSPENPHLGEISVKKQLKSYLAKVKRYAQVGSQVTSEDIITHSLLYDIGSESGFGRGYTGWMDISNSNQFNSSNTDRLLTHGAAQLGQGINAAYSAVERAEISQEMVIFQAVLIALVLAFGPMILILGMLTGRTISVTFTYYFLAGSLYFITFVEKFLHYLEMSLHASQSYGLYALGHFTMMYTVFTKLYFFAPMIYLGLMSVAGIGLGGALGSAFAGKSSGRAVEHAKNALMTASKMIK